MRITWNSPYATRQEIAAMLDVGFEKVVRVCRAMVPHISDEPGRREQFSIAEVAKVILAPQGDEAVIEALIRTRPEDLPDKLRVHFWQAKLKEQEFRTNEKDLWPTIELVEYMSDTFRVLRLSLQLLPDTLERSAKLTEAQRATVQSVVDETLSTMRRKLIDAFANRRKSEKRRQAPSRQNEETFDL
jgi:hypothetical protein